MPFVVGAVKLGFTTGMFDGRKSAWPGSEICTVELIVAFGGLSASMGRAFTARGGFVGGHAAISGADRTECQNLKDVNARRNDLPASENTRLGESGVSNGPLNGVLFKASFTNVD